MKRPMIRKRTKPRRGAELEPNYGAFLHEHGFCVGCFPTWSVAFHYPIRPTNYDCDGAHTENGGMSMKGPDRSRAPLCRVHHREYDAGRKAFELKYGVDMRSKAAAWYALYLTVKDQYANASEDR